MCTLLKANMIYCRQDKVISLRIIIYSDKVIENRIELSSVAVTEHWMSAERTQHVSRRARSRRGCTNTLRTRTRPKARR